MEVMVNGEEEDGKMNEVNALEKEKKSYENVRNEKKLREEGDIDDIVVQEVVKRRKR